MTKKSVFLVIAVMAILTAAAPQAQAQNVTYSFKPPKNNFYIKWKSGSGDTYFHGYINGGLWTGDSNGNEYFSTSDGKSYYRDNNKWYLDEETGANKVKQRLAEHLAEPEMIGSYYSTFWKLYNEGGNIKASLYHKGREKFLGINCDIFADNMNARYWIDPSNGCTLKIGSASGIVDYEVTEYNLNFTKWPSGLPPK